jgi:hypothetical protein
MKQQPMSIGAFLGWLVLFEAILLGIIFLVILWTPTIQGPVITVIALAGIIVILRAAFQLLWNRMLLNYPPHEIPAHATSKRFQSFSLGWVNMGLSINAAVDDTYLHIEPIFPWRLLGAASASIPFDAMTPIGKGRTVRVETWTMSGPRWCLERAGGQAPPQGP